jgi:hypothetical protein
MILLLLVYIAILQTIMLAEFAVMNLRINDIRREISYVR